MNKTENNCDRIEQVCLKENEQILIVRQHQQTEKEKEAEFQEILKIAKRDGGLLIGVNYGKS